MSERPDDHDGPIETPPEGSRCGVHPERPALAVCPRCGAFACIACWHHAIRRCHACLMRDPAAAAPPIPWEDERKALPMRFFGTLATALRPVSSAPAFARGGIAPARTFFLLTFLPLALLSAIVPFTHTLLFGPSFRVSLIGTPNHATIALDVLRAAAIGLLLGGAQVAALALPYASLSRAYASGGHEPAAMRVVLYRAYLLPLSQLLYHVVVWSAPERPPEAFVVGGALLQVLPLVLLFTALRATARMASGTGPLMSMVVTLVPFAVMLLVHAYAGEAASIVQPDPVALGVVEPGEAGAGVAPAAATEPDVPEGSR